MIGDQKVCDVIRVLFEREYGLVLAEIPHLHIAVVVATEGETSSEKKEGKKYSNVSVRRK